MKIAKKQSKQNLVEKQAIDNLFAHSSPLVFQETAKIQEQNWNTQDFLIRKNLSPRVKPVAKKLSKLIRNSPHLNPIKNQTHGSTPIHTTPNTFRFRKHISLPMNTRNLSMDSSTIQSPRTPLNKSTIFSRIQDKISDFSQSLEIHKNTGMFKNQQIVNKGLILTDDRPTHPISYSRYLRQTKQKLRLTHRLNGNRILQ